MGIAARFMFLGSAALAFGSIAALAQPDEVIDYATGAEPTSPEEYAKMPKQPRYRSALPARMDLSHLFPPVGHQGALPSCVAWATAYAARGFLTGQNLGRQPFNPDEQLSPSFIHNTLRPKMPHCRGSVPFRAALDMLKYDGVVSMTDFPYIAQECEKEPPAALVQKAASMRISDWRAIDRKVTDDWTTPIILDDVKGALSRGVPIIFAMPAGREFKSFKGERAKGIFQTTQKDGGYHAMAIVGYDEGLQAVRVMNSWGLDWGDKGFAWISYDTFELLAGEAYSLEAPRSPPKTLPVQTPKERFDEQLRTLPCATVRTATVNGRMTITGHSGDADAISNLKQSALAVDPRMVWQVNHRPWPQCEAETTLAPALNTQGVTLSLVSETGKAMAGDPVKMVEGQKFGLVATTTPARPWLSIVYLQADGSAVELYSGKPQSSGRNTLRVAIGQSGPVEARFEVGKPYGNEIIIALASSTPVFGAAMSGYTTEREFLTALRKRVNRQPRDTVAASVLRVKTSG